MTEASSPACRTAVPLLDAMNTRENPHQSLWEVTSRRAASSRASNVPLSRGLWGHFLVVQIAGPYTVGFVFVLASALQGDIEKGLLVNLLFGPLVLQVFALPFSIPVTIVTLLPAVVFAEIRSKALRRLAFVASGGLVGAMIGAWVVLCWGDLSDSPIVPFGTTLAGLICGYAEGDVWATPSDKGSGN